MVEHPADADGVLGGATIAELSDDVPVTDEFIEQSILKFGLASVGGSWRLRAHRNRHERIEREHGKTLHNGIMTDFHLSRDARNAKVFG